MPSAKFRRSPARTLSATGLSRSSLIRSSLMVRWSRLWICALVSDGYRRAPEQQEQETNITVHRKKRSIHPAQVVWRNQRILVGEKCSDPGGAHPGSPRQAEAPGEPRQQRDHEGVHGAGNLERSSDTETLWHRMQSGRFVVLNVLARVKHVEAADPKRYNSAEYQHACVE